MQSAFSIPWSRHSHPIFYLPFMLFGSRALPVLKDDFIFAIWIILPSSLRFALKAIWCRPWLSKEECNCGLRGASGELGCSIVIIIMLGTSPYPSLGHYSLDWWIGPLVGKDTVTISQNAKLGSSVILHFLWFYNTIHNTELFTFTTRVQYNMSIYEMLNVIELNKPTSESFDQKRG